MSRRLVNGLYLSPLLGLTIYTINMPAPAHIQRDTIDKFLTAWKDGNAQGSLDLWSEDFEQQLLPHSLQQPTRSRSHAEFFYPKLVNGLTNWKVGAHSYDCAVQRIKRK